MGLWEGRRSCEWEVNMKYDIPVLVGELFFVICSCFGFLRLILVHIVSDIYPCLPWFLLGEY